MKTEDFIYKKMEKVIGNASYDVIVCCPVCDHGFSAIDNDCDYAVCQAMFENTHESCTDMQIEMVCPECDCEFVLDSLEY